MVRRRSPFGSIGESSPILPEGLASRLRGIARGEILCRDFDRLWPEHLRAELKPEQGRAVALHVAGCRRCAALAEVFAAALIVEPEELPPALAARLAARLATLRRRSRPPLPFYLRDLRFAAAASWFLAFALAALAGGPEALAQRGRDAFGVPVTSAAIELEERGDRWTDRLALQTRQLGASLGGGWQRLGAEIGSGVRSLEEPFRNEASPAADELRRGGVPNQEPVHPKRGDR